MCELTLRFIEKALGVHGLIYDYSKSVYKKATSKVTIICKDHGEFEQTPNNHLSQKSGCPKCKKVKKLTAIEFIEKSDEIHDRKYDYSKVEYKNKRSSVIIICHKHGEFEQTPDHHIYNKRGCPKCRESLGEACIRKYLDKNSIKYIFDKPHGNCRNPETGYLLRFDFYLPDYNLCIEFDGQQHFDPYSFNKVKIINEKRTQVYKKEFFKDVVKNNYCEENDIKLLRIPYWKIKKIENILDLYIKEIENEN